MKKLLSLCLGVLLGFTSVGHALTADQLATANGWVLISNAEAQIVDGSEVTAISVVYLSRAGRWGTFVTIGNRAYGAGGSADASEILLGGELMTYTINQGQMDEDTVTEFIASPGNYYQTPSGGNIITFYENTGEAGNGVTSLVSFPITGLSMGHIKPQGVLNNSFFMTSTGLQSPVYGPSTTPAGISSWGSHPNYRTYKDVARNRYIFAMEDGGDNDYNDMVIAVDVGAVNMPPGAGNTAPTITSASFSPAAVFPGEMVKVVATAADNDGNLQNVRVWMGEGEWGPPSSYGDATNLNASVAASGASSSVEGSNFEAGEATTIIKAYVQAQDADGALSAVTTLTLVVSSPANTVIRNFNKVVGDVVNPYNDAASTATRVGREDETFVRPGGAPATLSSSVTLDEVGTWTYTLEQELLDNWDMPVGTSTIVVNYNVTNPTNAGPFNPMISAASFDKTEVFPGQTVTVSATATDQDGDLQSVHIWVGEGAWGPPSSHSDMSNANAFLGASGGSSTVSGNAFTAGAAGSTIRAYVQAADSRGVTSSFSTFTLTVSDPGGKQPGVTPTINGPVNVAVGSSVTYTASNGSTGNYVWGGTAGASGGGSSKEISFPTPGTYTVTLKDAGDATTEESSTVSLSVNAINQVIITIVNSDSGELSGSFQMSDHVPTTARDVGIFAEAEASGAFQFFGEWAVETETTINGLGGSEADSGNGPYGTKRSRLNIDGITYAGGVWTAATVKYNGATIATNVDVSTVTYYLRWYARADYPEGGLRLELFYTPAIEQTITFPAITDKLSTDAPFGLGATASSGLPVSYQVVSGPATVSGSTVTLTGGVGVVTIRATQAGNSIYLAADPVERSFAVSSPAPRLAALADVVVPDTYSGQTQAIVYGGQTSNRAKVTLVNEGLSALTVSLLTLTGGNVSEFAIVDATEAGESQMTAPALPLVLPGETSKELWVYFQPETGVHGDRQTTLRIGSDSAGGSPVDVPVRSRALAGRLVTTPGAVRSLP